ncbi:MAG TPA: hypothetical protein VFE60_17010 [Roseiarcus sp.]|nr:hypothetical protein [Roseiarcus sp.]
MAELLRVESLSAGYGEARVIRGVCFVLEDGRSLALLGRNGVAGSKLPQRPRRGRRGRDGFTIELDGR